MFWKWTSAEASDNPIGSPLNTRGSQIRYKVSLYSLSATIILKLISNNMHGSELLSRLGLMLLIWSKTLSKAFSELLIHTNYQNESFNLSLNVWGSFPRLSPKSSRWIGGRQKHTLWVQFDGHHLCHLWISQNDGAIIIVYCASAINGSCDLPHIIYVLK